MTMDRTSRTDRVLAGLIVELADTRTPDYLEAAIERASSRPQRPTWTFPGRWFPMAETVSRPALLPRLPWRTVGVALVLIALLVVAAILYVGSRPTKVPPPFGVARNGLIAYAADGDIYTADPVTGTATAIVTGPRIDRSPIFSHDGTHVAFLRESGTISAGPFELAVVDRDGGGFRVVTTLSVRPEFVDWYPDGSAILVNAGGQLTGYDVSGNRSPTFIADGVDVKPGAFRPPDGNQILFELGGPEDSGLYMMNVDGTGRRAVLEQTASNLGGSPNAARWSPDGRMIAFRVNVHGNPEQARLWVINADGTGLRQLDDATGVWVYNDLRWSPDGTRIAFNRWAMDETSRQWGVAPIGVVSIDGGPVQALGPSPHDDGALFDWSPDGSAIVSVPGPLGGFPLLTTTARPIEIDANQGISHELPWQVNSGTSYQRLAP